MKLTPIKSNMTELEFGHYALLFSYRTPVAYYFAGVGYAKTRKHWSVTTSKHINQWLNLRGYNAEHGDGLIEVDQEKLDNLANEVK